MFCQVKADIKKKFQENRRRKNCDKIVDKKKRIC